MRLERLNLMILTIGLLIFNIRCDLRNCLIIVKVRDGMESCNACEKGYYREEKTKDVFVCSECNGNCTECQGRNGEICLGCQNGFYLEKDFGECKECSEGCSKCTNDQICLECSLGYFKSDQVCHENTNLLWETTFGLFLLTFMVSGITYLICRCKVQSNDSFMAEPSNQDSSIYVIQKKYSESIEDNSNSIRYEDLESFDFASERNTTGLLFLEKSKISTLN